VDSINSINSTLRHDILPAPTHEALELLTTQQWLQEMGWYLAGGTALALQVGHRQSVDLDFFCSSSSFSLSSLTSYLQKLQWKHSILQEGTIYGELCGARVSFLSYPYFLPKEARINYGYVQILDAKDIAVMKIVAISQRGKKRDFYDLYWYVQHRENLETLFGRLRYQYPQVAHNYHHVLKSFTYFEDAENDPEPKIFFKVKWPDIKTFFKQEIKRITRILIDLD